jgi:uncharacterized LabA/DUF88 family protein
MVLRVSVFIDGANYYYMQRDKLGWWVDAAKLLEYIRRRTGGEIVDAYYYVGRTVPPEARQEQYVAALRNIGYSIYTKDVKEILNEEGVIDRKANLDIEIVLDMFNTIEHYDMAVLVSGDGDFERPLQLLRARGKRFLVMSTHGLVASELRDVAGLHYVDFRDIREQVERLRA